MLSIDYSHIQISYPIAFKISLTITKDNITNTKKRTTATTAAAKLIKPFEKIQLVIINEIIGAIIIDFIFIILFLLIYIIYYFKKH